jgi:DNA polymerase III subunit delta'
MASPAPAPWPDSLADTPAINVIERAIERRRLANSLLLHGENLGTLANVAHGIADRLLNADFSTAGAGLSHDEPGQESRRKAASTPEARTQYFPPKHHPDFFALRPAGKSRQISADATRELIGRIQVSPQISHRKVAVIYEADRMHPAAANIFLKTLEEPPASTTILLLTTHPYSLLATIRSRCLHFRFTDSGHEALAEADEATRDRWKSSLSGYTTWLEQLSAGTPDKRAVAAQVMGVYGLITRFNAVLDAATTQAWASQKEKLPDDLEDEEIDAIKTGISNGIRMKLFAEFERATAEFGRRQLAAGGAASRPMTAAIVQLEHDVGLLRVNLNEATALENFLLSSLRLWAKT